MKRSIRAALSSLGWLALVVGTAARSPAPPMTSAVPLNLSQDLVSLGIAPTNMIPDQPGLDAGPLLTAGVNWAKSHGISTVIANPGTYYLLSLQSFDRHVDLTSANNITIDLQGSDVLLGFIQHIGIALGSSTNTVLQNFTLDYMDLPFTQLQVDAVNAAARTVQYSVLPGWRDPNVFNSSQSPFGGDNIYAFVFRDGHPVFDLSRMEINRPFNGNAFLIKDDGFPWTTTQVLGRIRPGDVIVLTARGGGDPLVMTTCTGCTLRNIKVFSSAVNGVFVSETSSALLERVYVMPKPGTDRLISANADGITLDQPKANNTVRLSRVIRTLDDGFSPHSLILGTVAAQTGARQLTVTRQHANRIVNGSPVAFQRTTDGADLGVAVVTAQNPSPTQWVFGGAITMDFDRDLPGNLVGAAIYTTDPNQRGNNTVIERSAVEEQVFARGISLWGLVNSQIRKNFIWRANMSAVFGTHRLFVQDWMSPGLDSVVVSRNVIDGANRFGQGVLGKMAAIEMLAQKSDFQPMTVSPHINITIADNFIADPSRSAIRIENTTTGSATDNYLLNPNNRPYVDGYGEDIFEPYRTEFKAPVVVKTSSGVSTDANIVDLTSTRLFITDTQYRELAAYAPGAVIRLNAYGLGALENPAVTLTDADGTNTSLAIENATAHAFDVHLPSGAELGGAYLTLVSGLVKKFGTLFVDSQDNIPAVNGCTYEFSQPSAFVPASAASLPILVVTQGGCSYQPVASDNFVDAGSGGNATGVISITFAANPGTTRTTTLDIGGQTFTITQPSANLVSNGDFDNGMANWQTFATPDPNYLVGGVAGGVFEFYRLAPPSGTSNQAVVFQETHTALGANVRVSASFDLGNSSAVRKRISVLMLDSTFADLSVCTFWLPANTPMTTYQMKTHTTQPWANAAIYFYAATTDSNGGYYAVDKVSMFVDSGTVAQTECVDPTVPPPPGGIDSSNLIVNGDFNTGLLAPWSVFGTITAQINDGAVEFIQPTPTPPAGVVLQVTGQSMPVNQLLTATFQLGNSSSVRKRVTVLVHDSDFSDLAACTFWLAPGQPLSTYAMRTFTTEAWTNAMLSVYPATTGSEPWILLDNVTLKQTPGAALTGVTCLEPGSQ